MSPIESISRRYTDAPRAIRWLLAAVVFAALFFVWDATVWSASQRWDLKADRIEGQVDRVRNTSGLKSRLRKMDDSIVAIGAVSRPGAEDEGGSALNRAVVEVMGRHNVKYGGQLTDGDKLRDDVSRGIVRPGSQVKRLTWPLKFESSPDKAIAIIAEFESHEEIDAISKLTIRKSDSSRGPQVTVALTLESWVETPKGKRGR